LNAGRRNSAEKRFRPIDGDYFCAAQ
jgi:hypothetical protein